MKRFACLCLVLLLGACVERRSVTSSTAFSAQEAAFIKKPGTGTVTGHAFRTRSRGIVVNAAGEVVRLVPATDYAKARFRQIYGAAKYVPAGAYPRQDDVDPAYADYTRTTKSESNGRFVFDKVPPGTYFVTTQVVWGEEDALVRQGGSVYDMVTLTGRETEPVHVILSGN